MERSDGDVRGRVSSGLGPSRMRVTVADDALLPVLEAGSTVVVDCRDHTLVGGAIYAVRDGDRVGLWLFLDGFAGLGCRVAGRAVGTLSSLGEPSRWRGPLAIDAIALVGRVVEPAAGGLAELAAQQRRLAALRETTGTQLQRGGALGGPRPWPAGDSVEAVARAIAAELEDPAAAARLALEQRLDAIDARLALLDELIAAQPAASLADAIVKLETLAALQPLDSEDLEPRLLASALKALRRLATEPARPHLPGDVPARGEPLGSQLEPMAASPEVR